MKIFGGGNTLVECINPKLDRWIVLWDEQEKDGIVSYQSEILTSKPTIDEIKSVILNWYNTKIDNKILSGFTWNGFPIWLSMENQFNYKVAYDLAIQTDGRELPTFKFGTRDSPIYYSFKSLDELKNFYTSVVTYISDILAIGWREKDNIDWEAYETLLK